MCQPEELVFFLDGRKEHADDLEIALAKLIWSNRRVLPIYLLVTRWNGFGPRGRTTIFQFFIRETQEVSSRAALVNCVSEWGSVLRADMICECDSIYVDEPFLKLMPESLVLYYDNWRIERGILPSPAMAELGCAVELKETARNIRYEHSGSYLEQ